MEISLKYLLCLERPLFVVACQCPYRADILIKTEREKSPCNAQPVRNVSGEFYEKPVDN